MAEVKENMHRDSLMYVAQVSLEFAVQQRLTEGLPFLCLLKYRYRPLHTVGKKQVL